MTFAPPSPLQGTSPGNNADARVVEVRVMNAREPSPQQLAEAARVFEQHKTALRLSLAGFLTKDAILSDGSAVRIVSNSGHHTVMLWPAGATVELTDLLCGVFCIPADTTHQYGWVPPPVEDENGTPGSSGDRTDAGVFFPLKRTDDVTKAGGLLRFQEVYSPSATNIPFFEEDWHNNTTLQHWEFREWVSQDRKVVTFTHGGKIWANGAEVASSLPSTGLRTCIYKYDDEHYLFLVGFTSTSTLTAHRRKLSGGDWEAVATLDLSTLDSEVGGPPSGAGYTSTTALWWVKKVDFNRSGTVASVWVQNPATLLTTGTPNATRWVGITDIDMHTGDVSSNRVQGEVVRKIAAATGASGDPPWQDRIIWSGVRQISFDYVGDEKVFTELVFSGESTVTLTYLATLDERLLDYQRADNRKIVLRRGDLEFTLYENLEGTIDWHHESETDRDGDPMTPDPWTSSFHDYEFFECLRCQVMFYGGMGGTFLVWRRQQRFTNEASGSGSGSNAAAVTPYTVNRTTVTGDTQAELVAILPNGQEVEIESRVIAGSSGSTTFTVGLSISPQTFTAFDSNPTNEQRWGAAQVSLTHNSWILTSPPTLSPGISGQAVTLTAHPAYDDPDPTTTPDFALTKYMNGRCVDDFIIFSVPKLGPTGSPPRPDPTRFFTYCTDPSAVARMNIDPETGVLKGIRLK